VAATDTGPRLLPGPAHFVVIEDPAYLPSGAGEHWYVEIEKEGLNSERVAEALAAQFGLRRDAVGYAGRKDRHAISRQWFSVHLPGVAFDEARLSGLADRLAGGRIAVHTISRHKNKLRLGHLAGNRFRLGLAGIDAAQHARLTTALDRLVRDGVSNRFGSQRFGVNQATLRLAEAFGRGDHAGAVAWIVDPSGAWRPGQDLPSGFRHGPEGRVLGALRRRPDDFAGALRSVGRDLHQLAASAAQSAVFNAVLAGREAAGLLHTLRTGDLGCTIRGAPFVVAEADLADSNRRAAPGVLDCFATAPLPGDGRLVPAPPVDAEERAWAAATGIDWTWLAPGGALASPGERRPVVFTLRAPPQLSPLGDDPTWLELALPAGAYATEVLDQLGIEVPADRRG